MSEWLGTGLQNRSQRFESAWNLEKTSKIILEVFFFVKTSSDLRVHYGGQTLS